MTDPTVYVAELGGRAIAATEASSQWRAEQFFKGPFTEDLGDLLDSAGHPLGDRHATVSVRAATEIEAAQFQKSRAEQEATSHQEETSWVAFLVPVTGRAPPPPTAY